MYIYFPSMGYCELLNTKKCTLNIYYLNFVYSCPYTIYVEAQNTIRTYYSHIVCMGDEKEDSPANYKSLTKLPIFISG